MIVFEFKIVDLPKSPERYRLLTDTSGALALKLNGFEVFFHDSILLAEFARTLSEWITGVELGEKEDFKYRSMDFEEEPILAFEWEKDNKISLRSEVYMIDRGIRISPTCLVPAARDFLDELRVDLEEGGVDFDKFDSF